VIDRRLLREEPETVREALARKGVADVDLDRVVALDEEWRGLKSDGDELRRERNEVSSRIGELKAAGEEAAAAEAIERSQALKDEIRAVEERADELRSELDDAMLRIPQVPHESVPEGDDESDNVELRREGFDDRRGLPDEVVPHYDLGEELEILDFERGAKVTGGGYFFMKGDGARLEHALIRLMLDLHREQGYTQVHPPVPVNSASMRGTGQFPKFVEDAYRVGDRNDAPYDDDDLWLCPTAEVSVTNMYADEVLLDDDLPIKHQAYTPNFRREAGEHGTETRGMVRVHQFDKVELVNFVRPENSYSRLEGLLEEAESVLRELGLPYRVLDMCAGDMGFTQAKKYDVEVWAPADDMADGPDEGGRWLEVSSVSNFEAFQARRAGLRYRPERHESAEYLHTLNGSGVALPRVVVAIVEYYQNPDGTVTVPEPLRPYMGGQETLAGHEPVGEAAVGAGRKD
jgi:seryl-tRNA synthetase